MYRFFILIFLVLNFHAEISVSQFNNGKKIQYTFESKIPFKFKLISTKDDFTLFFNKKFEIQEDKLQNSIIGVTKEKGNFSTLNFKPRIRDIKYYAHQEQISDKLIKITFSKKKPKPTPYSTMQDVKNMLTGHAYIVVKFAKRNFKLSLNSPMRKDICTFKRGDYTYIAIETDREILFKIPQKKYVSDSKVIFQNGLQLIILKTTLFHKTTKTKDGWLIEFSKIPDTYNMDIDEKFLTKNLSEAVNNRDTPSKYEYIDKIVRNKKSLLKYNDFINKNPNKIKLEFSEPAFFFKLKDPIYQDEIIIIPLYNEIKNRHKISNQYFDMMKTNQGIALKINDEKIKISYKDTKFVMKNAQPFLLADDKKRDKFDLINISNFVKTIPWNEEYNLLRKQILDDPYDYNSFKFSKFLAKNSLNKESQQSFYNMFFNIKNTVLKTRIFFNMGVNGFLNYDFDEAIYFLENQDAIQNETLSMIVKIAYALKNDQMTHFKINNLKNFLNNLEKFGNNIKKKILITILHFNKKIFIDDFSIILTELFNCNLSKEENNLFLLNRARSFFRQKLFSQAIEDLKNIKTMDLLIFSEAEILKNKTLLRIKKISENIFIKNLKILKISNTYSEKKIETELQLAYLRNKMFFDAIMIMRKNPQNKAQIKKIIGDNYKYFISLPFLKLMDFINIFEEFLDKKYKKSIAVFFFYNKFLNKSFNVFREIILKYKEKNDIDLMIKLFGMVYPPKAIEDFLKDNKDFIGISNKEMAVYLGRVYYMQNQYGKVIDNFKNFNLKKSLEAFSTVAKSYFMLGEYKKSEIIFLKMFEVFYEKLSEKDIFEIITILVYNKQSEAAYKIYQNIKARISIECENRIRKLLYSARNINEIN